MVAVLPKQTQREGGQNNKQKRKKLSCGDQNHLSVLCMESLLWNNVLDHQFKRRVIILKKCVIY